jgi:hypothetical protein
VKKRIQKTDMCELPAHVCFSADAGVLLLCILTVDANYLDYQPTWARQLAQVLLQDLSLSISGEISMGNTLQ